jgi:hypothetical protein
MSNQIGTMHDAYSARVRSRGTEAGSTETRPYIDVATAWERPITERALPRVRSLSASIKIPGYADPGNLAGDSAFAVT